MNLRAIDQKGSEFAGVLVVTDGGVIPVITGNHENVLAA